MADDYRDSTVLVTGASSGIGAALADAFAARGARLVLAAQAETRLRSVAEGLRERHGADVLVVPVDLANEDGPDRLAARVREAGLAVDVLVNNAGFGTHGRFHELSADTDHREVMVNVAAVERMTHLFLPEMVRAGRGTLINISSTSAFQAVPYMAVYGASKAFVLSFSLALWGEYRKQGIKVLAVCPGPTDTPFFDTLGVRLKAGGRLRTTDEVVAATFRALQRGRPFVVDGQLNQLLVAATRFLSRPMLARITERVLRRPPRLPTPPATPEAPDRPAAA